MKLKVSKNHEEHLLSRHKIEADLEFDAVVPARKDIIQKLAESFSVEPDLVVVKNVDVVFGTHKAKVHAYTYKSKEERDRISLSTFEEHKEEVLSGNEAI